MISVRATPSLPAPFRGRTRSIRQANSNVLPLLQGEVRWGSAVLAAAAALLSLAACSTAPDIAALEARIQQQEDTEAIRRLITDYGRLLDEQDFERFSQLFAADGVWAGGGGDPPVGPAAIEVAMERAFGSGSGVVWGASFHVLGNEVIDVDGDRATAISRWMFVQAGADGAPSFVIAGRYRDAFVREDGAWKFARRELINDMALEGFLGAPPTDE